jgi:hypothetical protein
MNKEYENEVLMVCHQSAESLLRMGIIDADEMREFDEGCLVKGPEPAYEAEKPVVMEHVTT